jgi:hypothetical protein
VDGRVWNASTSGAFVNYAVGVAWNGSMWVACGDGGSASSNILWRTDGKAWNASTSGAFSSWGGRLAWNGSLWVACGGGGSASSNILWSTDGKVWNASTSGAFVNYGSSVASAIPLTVYTGPVSVGGNASAGNLLTATGPANGVYGNSKLTFNGTLLSVNGGLSLTNGYRPLYQQVTASPLTVASNSYGTYYNITYSSLTAITLPAVVGSNDANAYWVFRNNSGSSLSITFTYTTAGTTYPSNPVSIPSASSVTMMVTYPSSVLGYVLF